MKKSLIFIVSILMVIACNYTPSNKSQVSLTNINKQKIPNCNGDTTFISIDTLNHLDIDNSGNKLNSTSEFSKIILHYKDDNDVWFNKETSSDHIRIVYQGEKKVLLVYLDDKLFRKYNDVIVHEITKTSFRCTDNGYVKYEPSVLHPKNPTIEYKAYDSKRTLIKLTENQENDSYGLFVDYYYGMSTYYSFYSVDGIKFPFK